MSTKIGSNLSYMCLYEKQKYIQLDKHLLARF